MALRKAWNGIIISSHLQLQSLPFLSHFSFLYSFSSSSSSSPNQNDTAPFNHHLPTLLPSNDAELLSKLLLQHHDPLHAMEFSLQLHGITLSSDLLHQTLLRLKHSSKIALSIFHYSKTLPEPPVTATTYNILVDILAQLCQFDVAWQLILEMDQSKIKPSCSTFLILIRRLIAAGLTRQAVRAFDEMGYFVESQRTVEDFLFLMDTLCKYGYVRVAAELFNQRKHGFVPDVRVYTVLIYGWCKIRRIDVAERFLREMMERGIEPNVVIYNVLLNGICRRASLQPDGFEKTIRNAEKVFDEMSSRGIKPDVTSFSTVLHAYSRAHKPELSLDKLKLMRELGISPSVATYTSVVKCLCSCGRLEDAEELLDEMVRNEVTPCSETYNCFFKEYGGRKDVKGALKLYKRMKHEGLCMPSMHTYNLLVGMFLKLNSVEIAKEIWRDMEESGIGPDLDSYTLFICGLCEQQKWREACEYFMQMIEKGFLPQKITFETLYRGLVQSDMLKTWRRLKKKLDEESITFGSEFQSYHLKPHKRI